MLAFSARASAALFNVGSRRASAALVVLTACLAASPALARRDATFNYSYSRVWTAAVRLVRVELECPISEKDKEDGYFFFEYSNQGKSHPGTVELVAAATDSGEQVRVIVQVPAMPSYVEGMILDRLAKKLEKEFGAPRPTAPPKPAAKPDGEEEPSTDKSGKAPARRGDAPSD